MPDTVEGTGDGVPRWIRRERPRYPRGFMADPLKTYRLPTRADIRPGGDLRDTDLVQATLQSADLSGADLSGADLFQSNLRNADLTGATLTGACLYGADLSGARIDGADLSGAELFNAALGKATFDRAILKGATINTFGSWVKGPASMRGADLSGAILFWCEMAGVDLTGANLTGAVVRAPGTWQRTIGEDGGTLAGAVLDGAILDDLVAVSDWPRRAKYRSTHPRRTRKGNFPEATRKEALARAGNRCEQCLATGRLDVDHVIAI
ncbi:MAG: pentapeptide repeat-containing protein, partial [Chloroflexi bacterium]|nr:pentapeptide repeat-containing protein [Chloroflexota bacterium]